MAAKLQPVFLSKSDIFQPGSCYLIGSGNGKRRQQAAVAGRRVQLVFEKSRRPATRGIREVTRRRHAGGLGIPARRTKIMELPSIGARLNYTRRSFFYFVWIAHACACNSLPRIRLTPRPRESRERYLVYRAERARMSSHRVSYFPILYDFGKGRVFFFSPPNSTIYSIAGRLESLA